jgi:AraC-like DNA-binding protein
LTSALLRSKKNERFEFPEYGVKSLPFAVQLSLIVFLILIVPFIILMSYTGSTTLKFSEEEIARSSLENIGLNSRLTEAFMDNISANTHRFAAYHDFFIYDGLQKYSAIQGNVENGMRIQRLQRELVSIARVDERAIHSVFMLFDGGDYVISTDRGIVELSDYYSASWLNSFSRQRQGLGGIWVPRRLPSATVRETLRGQDSGRTIPVISYVYNLNRLTTAMSATIVINVRESSIANNLNPGRARDDRPGIMLLEGDGRIISHPLESNFLGQGRNLPHIADILDRGENTGYGFYTEEGGQYLYTWLKTTNHYEWVYVSVQSMAGLLNQSARNTRNMIFLSLTVLFFGTMTALAVLFWVSRPMRELVKDLKGSEAIKETALRNEMDILSSAFTHIENKEKELKFLLGEREKDTELLAIRNLLEDGPLPRQEAEILEQVFPHRLFRVAVAAPDNFDDYHRRTSAEQRSYQRYLFISRAAEINISPMVLRGVYFLESQIALIINMIDENDLGKLLPFLGDLQEIARPVFGTTITIGLSETGFDLDAVYQCGRQASEAVTMRMLRGSNSIIQWTHKEGRKRFFYPYNSEAKIFNYLNTGNMAQIGAELEAIKKAVRSTEGISYDNICYIYNQLAGGTIRRLSEMNINTTGIFFSHGNVCRAIASSETLETLSRCMNDFYEDLLHYLRKDKDEEQAIDRIMACLAKNFRKDMFFEDMAAEVNISYSYMRKIVKEKTGRSVNETVNFLRIQEAKSLLLDDKLKLPEIAKRTGYRNTQSLKRYFRKFEGLSPLEYRLVNNVGQF